MEDGKQRKRPRHSLEPESSVRPLGRRRWCVAVHVGAGYHKPELEPQWRATLSAACAAAATVLNDPELMGSNMPAQNDFVPCAMRAVTAALASLEDDARTNAGLGSNLTEGGQVEADARYEAISLRSFP
eukprot:COSAG02_NODE_981_length_15488_cov_27.585093_4_plen_129_part_00